MDDPPQIGPELEPRTDGSPSLEREARRAALRAAIQRGLDDANAGRVVDLDEGIERVLRNIREKASSSAS